MCVCLISLKRSVCLFVRGSLKTLEEDESESMVALLCELYEEAPPAPEEVVAVVMAQVEGHGAGDAVELLGGAEAVGPRRQDGSPQALSVRDAARQLGERKSDVPI